LKRKSKACMLLVAITLGFICTPLIDARSAPPPPWNGGGADDLPGYSTKTVIIAGVVIAAAAIAIVLIVKKATSSNDGKTAPADTTKFHGMNQEPSENISLAALSPQYTPHVLGPVNERSDIDNSIQDRIHPVLLINRTKDVYIGMMFRF
jgi:hypothetical protein